MTIIQRVEQDGLWLNECCPLCHGINAFVVSPSLRDFNAFVFRESNFRVRFYAPVAVVVFLVSRNGLCRCPGELVVPFVYNIKPLWFSECSESIRRYSPRGASASENTVSCLPDFSWGWSRSLLMPWLIVPLIGNLLSFLSESFPSISTLWSSNWDSACAAPPSQVVSAMMSRRPQLLLGCQFWFLVAPYLSMPLLFAHYHDGCPLLRLGLHFAWPLRPLMDILILVSPQPFLVAVPVSLDENFQPVCQIILFLPYFGLHVLLNMVFPPRRLADDGVRFRLGARLWARPNCSFWWLTFSFAVLHRSTVCNGPVLSLGVPWRRKWLSWARNSTFCGLLPDFFWMLASYAEILVALDFKGRTRMVPTSWRNTVEDIRENKFVGV